ncbi:hypothetical protein OESDEN_06012 [Oesophagostomum dentatum]|uniref:Uncharacterized protein n=1 Tax=Oesophagostomum dentatum TaxID=61180 RepID=A0A0B1T925_OESDE|nr:hypothetical protein OESDEN_06012 [Oesophagostomum dentatum]
METLSPYPWKHGESALLSAYTLQPTQFRRRFADGVVAFCGGHKLHPAFVSCRMDSGEYQNVLR